jgi:ubiquitin C-terminal hydrolase
MCLEPPLRVDELPEEDDWYCRKCRVDRVSHLSIRLHREIGVLMVETS